VGEDQEHDEVECGPANAGHGHDSVSAAAAAAAFKFDDGVGRLSGVQAAMNALAATKGVGAGGLLGIEGPNFARLTEGLVGRHLGLGFDATTVGRSFGFAKLAGLDAVSERVSASAKSWMASVDGVNSGLAAAAAAAFKFDDGSGLLGGEHAARMAMNWANEELGRHPHGLTGLVGAGSAMADHMSIFDKVMRDSQWSMHEAMGRWSMPGPAAWMTEVMRGPAESIAATMRGWSALADGGLWAARLALRMALAAKRAVMRGDIDAVKRFLRDWLDFQFEFVTLDLVSSASLVLLDERAWLPDDVLALDYDPCPKLRKLTLAEHRSCTRLIIDPRRRAHHKPVLSLDKRITKMDSDSTTTTLLELVVAKPQPELAAGEDDISDPRVLRVLAKLTDRERKIADERGHVGTTWAEAAVACGGTADEGEKLRRKVKRLSKATGTPAAACPQPGAAPRAVSALAVI
jgi:hypothetical protein